MTEEVSDIQHPPKDSFRALLHLKANGAPVTEYELHVWRREEALIRSAIDDPLAYCDARLEAAHFLAPVHGVAWGAIMRIVNNESQDNIRDGIDERVLLYQMRSLNESLGGPRGRNWLLSVMREEPVGAQYGRLLATEVRQLYRMKHWRTRGRELDSRVDTDVHLPELEADYARFGNDVVHEAKSDTQIVKPMDEMEWDPHTLTANAVVKTGNEFIDRYAAGGHGRGELLVWGGGTGVGKSYAAQRLMRQQAKLGQRVLYISCEDGQELMYCRTLADYSEPCVSPAAIRMRKADPIIVERAQDRMKAEQKGRVLVVEMKKPTISQVVSCIRQHHFFCLQDGGLSMVIIDYLQAISVDEPINNKVQEMAMVTSELKRAFTECRVAGVAFSQYARDEYRAGKEPDINACKYCGDIENESEIMVLMWRDPDGVLHAKIPKVKWAAANQLRFIVPVHPVTGCHGEWQEDHSATDEDDDDDG